MRVKACFESSFSFSSVSFTGWLFHARTRCKRIKIVSLAIFFFTLHLQLSVHLHPVSLSFALFKLAFSPKRNLFSYTKLCLHFTVVISYQDLFLARFSCSSTPFTCFLLFSSLIIIIILASTIPVVNNYCFTNCMFGSQIQTELTYYNTPFLTLTTMPAIH